MWMLLRISDERILKSNEMTQKTLSSLQYITSLRHKQKGKLLVNLVQQWHWSLGVTRDIRSWTQVWVICITLRFCRDIKLPCHESILILVCMFEDPFSLRCYQRNFYLKSYFHMFHYDKRKKLFLLSHRWQKILECNFYRQTFLDWYIRHEPFVKSTPKFTSLLQQKSTKSNVH